MNYLYALRHTATIRIDGKISIQAVTYIISRAMRHMRQIANTAVFRSDVPLHIHAMWHVKAYLQHMRRELHDRVLIQYCKTYCIFAGNEFANVSCIFLTRRT